MLRQDIYTHICALVIYAGEFFVIFFSLEGPQRAVRRPIAESRRSYWGRKEEGIDSSVFFHLLFFFKTFSSFFLRFLCWEKEGGGGHFGTAHRSHLSIVYISHVPSSFFFPSFYEEEGERPTGIGGVWSSSSLYSLNFLFLFSSSFLLLLSARSSPFLIRQRRRNR